MSSALIDAAFRAAYRTAHPLWSRYLQTFGAVTRGAQIAVWHRGRVLLIRNSYRRRYTFPGGHLGQEEDSATGASRELREETGIALPVETLRFAGAWVDVRGRLEAHDDIYECSFDREPKIDIDNREVVEARFVAPQTADELPLERHVRHYLDSARRNMGYSAVRPAINRGTTK